MKTVKLNVEGLRLTVTKDNFFKLTYTGNNRMGDHYEVCHEAPSDGYFQKDMSIINDLIRAVLSEAAQLHG